MWKQVPFISVGCAPNLFTIRVQVQVDKQRAAPVRCLAEMPQAEYDEDDCILQLGSSVW